MRWRFEERFFFQDRMGLLVFCRKPADHPRVVIRPFVATTGVNLRVNIETNIVVVVVLLLVVVVLLLVVLYIMVGVFVAYQGRAENHATCTMHDLHQPARYIKPSATS